MIKQGAQWKLVSLHIGVDSIETPLIDGYCSAFWFGGVIIEINRQLFNK